MINSPSPQNGSIGIKDHDDGHLDSDDAHTFSQKKAIDPLSYKEEG